MNTSNPGSGEPTIRDTLDRAGMLEGEHSLLRSIFTGNPYIGKNAIIGVVGGELGGVEIRTPLDGPSSLLSGAESGEGGTGEDLPLFVSEDGTEIYENDAVLKWIEKRRADISKRSLALPDQ